VHEHLYGAFALAKHRGDIGRRQPTEKPQRQRFALVWRQLRHGMLDCHCTIR
jgi:hypothetical protein